MIWVSLFYYDTVRIVLQKPFPKPPRAESDVFFSESLTRCEGDGTAAVCVQGYFRSGVKSWVGC